ncbi:MAG: transporter substrate-binding domain-containing protein [Inhella sp.]
MKLWPALLLLTALPQAVQAGCSRPIQVPVGPVGLSVVVDGDQISGAYPLLLQQLGATQGCRFVFQPVPRARLERLFETGAADLIVPATHSERRDAYGEFVPLILSRAAAVSLQSSRPPLRSIAELLARKELRVVVVRGFDFGAPYQRLVEQLREQGRLQQESEVGTLLRALQEGHADLAVLSPTNVYGVAPPGGKPLDPQLRVEPLDDLPWREAGFYLSNKSLSPADRDLLRQMLQEAERSGAVWRALSLAYPPQALEGAMKSR